MDVGFSESTEQLSRRADIEGVLQWLSLDVERIDVVSSLSGGRSGALVLLAEMEYRDGRTGRRVIKIDDAESIAREWRAYDGHLRKLSLAGVTPVDDVSPIIRAGETDLVDRMAAIVYAEVASYASSEGSPESLEDVARKAIQTGQVVKILPLLGQALRVIRALHSPVFPVSSKRTLRAQNDRLGTDLVLEVDRIETGELKFGAPLRSERAGLRRVPLQILQASTRTPGVRDTSGTGINHEDVILIEDLTVVRTSDTRLRGSSDVVSVEIRPTEAARIGVLAGPDVPLNRVRVIGRVAQLRSEAHMNLIRLLCPDLAFTADEVTLDGVTIRQPYAELYQVLTEDVAGRAYASISHGDLNPRNIIVADGQVFLIDFAEIVDKMPLFLDAAWLETSLMRDVIAHELSWAELVRLQRLLCFGSYTADVARRGTDEAWFGNQLGDESPSFQAAFEVLQTIRRRSRADYPATASEDWFRAYLGQLTLASCRTFKWPAHQQTDRGVQAMIVQAGVAAEWLGHSPYRWWPVAQVRDAALALSALVASVPELTAIDRSDRRPIEELAHRAAGHLADIVDACALQLQTEGETAVLDRDVWTALERTRATVVRAAYRNQALADADVRRGAHEVFIGLQAFIELNATSEEARAPYSLYDVPSDYQDPFNRDPVDYGNPFGYRAVEHSRDDGFSLEPRDDQLPPDKAGPEQDPARAYGYRQALPDNLRPTAEAMQLIVGRPEVVVLGAAGSGKSTIALELQFRLARAIIDDAGPDGTSGSLPPLLPVRVKAPAIDLALMSLQSEKRSIENESYALADPCLILRAIYAKAELNAAMLACGGVHITVDALNELDRSSKRRVAAWIRRLRARFPQTPVMVCHRTFDFEADQLRYPTVRLHNVTSEQAKEYIRGVMRGLPDGLDRSQRLISLLLGDSVNARVRDLARTPLFLWMIVKHFAESGEVPTTIGNLFEEFVTWLLNHPPDEDDAAPPVPSMYSLGARETALKAIGAFLVEHGNITDLAAVPSDDFPNDAVAGRDRAIALIGILNPPIDNASAMLDDLLASGILDSSGASLGFYHQSFQEYYAALVLFEQAMDATVLEQRARQFAWRESLRIMVTFLGDEPELIRRVVDIVLQTSPKEAASLLNLCELIPPEVQEAFVAQQCTALNDVNAGSEAWREAAEALAVRGTADSLHALRDAVKNSCAVTDARVAALNALFGDDATGDQQNEFLAPTISCVRGLLTEATPNDLRVSAIEWVGRRNLRELVLPVADLIDSSQSWVIVRAAATALHSLGEPLAGRRESTYLDACQRGLAEIDAEIRTSPDSSDHLDDLSSERERLIHQLGEAGRLQAVLPYRFVEYGPSPFIWSDWLARYRVALSSESEVDKVLSGAIPINELLSVFVESDDPVVVNAAATVYLDSGGSAENLLQCLDPQAGRAQLLAAASAINPLSFDEDRLLENLIRALSESLSPASDFEALAALINAYEADDVTKSVLIARALTRCTDLPGPRYLWRPIAEIWLTMNLVTAAEASELLVMGGEVMDATVRRLSARATSVSLLNYETLEVSDDARAALSRWEPSQASTMTEVAKVRAEVLKIRAAQVIGGAPGAINRFISILRDPEVHLPFTNLFRDSGSEEVTDCAQLLPVGARLARLAFERGDLEEATAAVHAIRYLDVGNVHQADRLGRLVALAALGEWQPLLEGLPDEAGLWHQAAVSAVKDPWFPGPLAPPDPDRAVIAQWTADRLARSDLGLSADVRDTLTKIKSAIENEFQEYFIPAHNRYESANG